MFPFDMFCPRYRDACLLFFILLCAFALRLWNHDFDPLYENRPRRGDELKKRTQALAASRHEFSPERHMQPYYLIHTTGWLIRALSPSDPEDPRFLWRVGVFSMIGYSLATILLLYWFARAVFDSSGVGLLAALFLAVVPLNVMGSRYFKEDIPLMFFMNVSMLFLALVARKGRGVFYILAATAIGLSVAVKYAALNLVPFYVAAHAVAVWRSAREERVRRLPAWQFLVGPVLMLCAFTAFNTHAVTDWEAFCEGFRTQLQYAGSGHHDGTAISGWEYAWTFYFRYAVVPGIGLPAAVAALAGIVLAVRRKMVAATFVAAWIVVFYLGLEKSPAKPFPFFARYMHGISPGLCMFAAFAFHEACGAWAGRRLRTSLCVGVAVLAILLPLGKTCLVNHSIGAGRETRDRARAWMSDNLEPGSKIFVDSRSYGAEPAADKFDVRRRFHRNLDYLQNRGVDYIVLGSYSHERFTYDKNPGKQAVQMYGYYQSVFRECELLYEAKPWFPFMSYGFHNPVISIYKVPKKRVDGET